MNAFSKKSKNITETTIVKIGNGSVNKIIVNSHTSGTVKIIDGMTNGAKATGVLTSSGACVPANYAVTVLTGTGVFSANETIVIGSRTYKMVVAPADAYDVKIGDTLAESLDNIKLAVNATGTAGTNYGVGTLAHPDIIATTNTDTAQTFRSRNIGTVAETTAINAIATTETCANASFPDTTLGGGTGASDPAVTSDGAKIVIGSQTYTAVLTLAESIGLTAVPYQVLWVTNEATFLDNFKSAINNTGTMGTDYSTGTEQHPDVVATTNTATAQTIESKLIGSSQNAIATTETLANYAWGAGTLASGTLSTGRILNETITLGTVTAGIDRTLDLGDLEFNTALLVVIGGTANLTVVYDN